MDVLEVYAHSRRFITTGLVTRVLTGNYLCFLLRCVKIWKLMNSFEILRLQTPHL